MGRHWGGSARIIRDEASYEHGVFVMAKDDELVLVVDRDRLFPEGAFSGVKSEGVAEFFRRIAAGLHWLRRGDAERDEQVKQVIPYCVVRDGKRVFLTRRLATQSEVRLHNLYSIGIGGHMNMTGDPGLTELIASNLRRELDEELVLPEPERISLIGALNDDATSVSRCHFGLLYEVRVSSDVSVRETDKMTGRWADLAELAPGTEIHAGLEDWSRHAVTVLLAGCEAQEG
jgi:predicted NUDIX family phosphoesterase